jgi:hypothetical protein
MKTAILIAGRAGTGKDTAADYLYQVLAGEKRSVSIDHFASGIKQFAKWMGWDGVKDAKGRALLQDLGKIGRAYDENTWCKYLFNNTLDRDIIIIPDWRFPNEYAFVKRKGLNVITIRMYAPDREMLKGTDRYNDISETSLPEPYFIEGSYVMKSSNYDFIAINSSTKEHLYSKLDNILGSIRRNL